MAEDINLLPELTEAEKKKSSQSRSINFVAIVALLIVGAILLGLFGYWVFLAANAQRIKSQTESAEKEILQNNRKEVTHRALVDKLESAEQFVEGVVAYSGAYDKIFKFLNESGITLKGTEVKNKGDVAVTGQMGNISPFVSFTDKLLQTSQQGDFGNVSLVSLRKEKDKPYEFVVSLKYLKRGLINATESSSLNQ